MNRTRSLSAGAAVVLVAGGAAVASGAVSAPGLPPAKSLAQAIHDSISAPPVRGITARIDFTNKLIDSSSLAGGGPLLVGASGRLWISADGRARIELQSDRGDAQLTTDGQTVTLYDASSNTAYKATLPQESGDHAARPAGTTPSVAKISHVLAKVGQAVGLSGADPAVVGGQSAYSVKLTPKNGGLVGKAELAWDAATGVPLRAGVYAAGTTEPVLQLSASDVSYGPVDEGALSVPIPAGAKVETIDLPSDSASKADAPTAMDKAKYKAEVERRKAMTPADVAKALAFTLSAPDSLAGQSRTAVKLVGSGEHRGALVTYGTGLGGIAVLEMPAKAGAAPAPAAPAKRSRHGSGDSLLQIPTIDVNGAKAMQLSTALGSIMRFQRGGVQFTVGGSVTAAVATTAARGL